jgi:hypothetical protein
MLSRIVLRLGMFSPGVETEAEIRDVARLGRVSHAQPHAAAGGMADTGTASLEL